jgi:hypothetical protein
LLSRYLLNITVTTVSYYLIPILIYISGRAGDTFLLKSTNNKMFLFISFILYGGDYIYVNF